MRDIGFKELCETLRASKGKKAVLTFHAIGDRDGVGSAVALAKYFDEATVVTPDFITNNARHMLSYIHMENAVSTKFPDDAEMVIVLDVNNLFPLGRLADKVENFEGEVLFIDHHALHEGKEAKDALMFNTEDYNSTASIVYDVLKEIKAPITKETAILLLNGITADSADLQNSTPHTFMQISEMLETSGMEYSFFTNYFRAAIPARSKYQVIQDVSRASAEMIGNYVLVYGQAKEHANVAADSALKLDADITVFWVISSTEASISARMHAPLDKELSIHLGVMMRETGKMLGGNGGGHACAAGAYGPNKNAAREAAEELVERIKEKLREAQKR